MNKSIGKGYLNQQERESFLKDNCDKVEEKGYTKPYSPEELQTHKENLANLSIEIDEVEDEKKASAKHFKSVLDPKIERRRELVSNIRKKAEYVKEICYKFVDTEERMVGYYNSDGDLIESRPATVDELQPTIFSIARKNGTND
jgi:hypothetical protein